MKTVEERMKELQAEADAMLGGMREWRHFSEGVAKQLTQQAAEWQIAVNEERAAGQATVGRVRTAKDAQFAAEKRELTSRAVQAIACLYPEDRNQAQARAFMTAKLANSDAVTKPDRDPFWIISDEEWAKVRNAQESKCGACEQHLADANRLAEKLQERDAELARMYRVMTAREDSLQEKLLARRLQGVSLVITDEMAGALVRNLLVDACKKL